MRSTTIQNALNVDGHIDANGAAIPAGQQFCFSAQIVVGGGTTGTLKVQYSNDVPNPVVTGWAPTNWVDITGANSTVSGNGVTGIQKTEICAAWIRPVWTHNNGTTGSVVVNIQVMGP